MLFMKANTASKAAKQAGLKGLTEMANITDTSRTALYNWFEHHVDRFNCLLRGAVEKKKEITAAGSGDQ